MSKYSVNPNEEEILPNLLNSNSLREIQEAEFEGFLYAELLLTTQLTEKTKFDVDYIKNIHFLALKDVYAFAGNFRTVNISKQGFMFPTARFLDQSMQEFQTEILNKLLNEYVKLDSVLFIEDLARVHAELLYIHPFREGNGRTARVLLNLMLRKNGWEPLDFSKMNEELFQQYVIAVQSSAMKNYEPMKKVIEQLF
ncbi:Fic/DOC family protein [Cloacibacterium normanense]|uniref:Fic/DOC family protein n=1 Tax=Cloacibacterium normanense TaxID=237258 RepID=UPI00391A6A0C